jgi:hypothetical protein
MTGMYKLEGHEVVPVDSIDDWGEMFQDTESRRVGQREYIGVYEVSTVFLGIDHGFSGGAPLLFETMVFGDGPRDGEQYRYATWDEAEAGHKRVVAELESEWSGKRGKEVGE